MQKSKIAAILIGAGALIGFIVGFIFINTFCKALEPLSGFLPINFKVIYIIELVLLYVPEILVTIGLLLKWKWARNLGIYWGVVAVLTIISSISHPNFMLVPELMTLAGAVLLFLEKREEKK